MDSPGRTGFRWSVADASASSQLALFDEPERVVGRGEFRGLEFIHVAARRILNRVPDRSPMPFRWTINAYRGCTMSCAYCYARPTHEYLNLDPATDFDRVIVVKTNAVERLRAELAPSRWAGESIAMGTNTDPYQRAEGKYRLTRGMVEVLGETANPFSILTKGTLILRDLDVLAAATRSTNVECCFSIGTVDEEVWRMTEPGTPHPRKRLEAVARLNEAGVSCGVLIGPIIPGLSDRPDQLDAVVAGCVEAGARTIGHVVLHLRTGVREHWMDALRSTRPDLADRHKELYRRGAYAPHLERARIGRIVDEALQRHRRGRSDRGHSPPISARFQPTARRLLP